MAKCKCYEVSTDCEMGLYDYDLGLAIVNDLLTMGYEVIYNEDGQVFSTENVFKTKGESIQTAILYRFNSFTTIEIFSDIPEDELIKYFKDRSKLIILDSEPYIDNFDIISKLNCIYKTERYSFYYKRNSIIYLCDYYMDIMNNVITDKDLDDPSNKIKIYGIS